MTKVDPNEIPEVTNKFLMRSDGSDRRRRSRSTDRKRRDRSDERNKNRAFGWSKQTQSKSRSGRTVKGRGVFVSFQSRYKNYLFLTLKIIFRATGLHLVPEVSLEMLHHLIGDKQRKEP